MQVSKGSYERGSPPAEESQTPGKILSRPTPLHAPLPRPWKQAPGMRMASTLPAAEEDAQQERQDLRSVWAAPTPSQRQLRARGPTTFREATRSREGSDALS